MVDEPRSYTDLDAARITPNQVRAAAARGSLTAPQMQRRFGGAPPSSKELLRRLLLVASIGASERSSGGASKGPSGVSGVPPMADGPEAVSPVPATGGSLGTNELGSDHERATTSFYGSMLSIGEYLAAPLEKC